MALRTATIHTNDLFHFGNTRHWWCYAIINFWRPGVEIEIFEPPYGPNFTWGPGPFFYHFKANGGIWSVGAELPIDKTVEHDWGIIYRNSSYRAGKEVDSHYVVRFDFVPFASLVLSTLILLHWAAEVRRKHRLRFKNLCPTCSYDLRAHNLGDKCPECGTPITTTLPPNPT